MIPIAHTREVTGEDEVGDLGRQHRAAKQVTVTDARHDDAVQSLQQLRIERQLLVVLDLARGHPGAQLAVDKSRLRQHLVDLVQLCWVQQLRNLQEHAGTSPSR